MLEQAAADLRVATGMLDARHLAGDPNLTLRLRTAVLTQWRRDARTRLGELHELVSERGRMSGELAHASVPDLKESVGGLRDATVLKALVASWLVDVPHGDLERCRMALLDVRDALHTVAGRATDRVAPEFWEEIAPVLGLPDGTAAQVHTRGLARRLTHLSRLAWRRAEAVQRRPSASGGRRPRLETDRAGGRGLLRGGRARPGREAGRGPAAAAACRRRGGRARPGPGADDRRAAGRGEPRRSPTRGRPRRATCSCGCSPPDPGCSASGRRSTRPGRWSGSCPSGSGCGCCRTPRSCTGSPSTGTSWRPASRRRALIRRVARPDVLMVAALLHDIGKGQLTEHCVAGSPIARDIAQRIGFDEREVELIVALVRWHLLLPETATTRDPDDPATVELVTAKVADREELELLAALTEADARATSEKAWTSWRASLVRSLVRRAAAALADEPVPDDGDHRDRDPRAACWPTPRPSRWSRSTGDGAAGHRRLGRPHRAARRRGRDARAAEGVRPRGPGLDPGRVRGLGVGRGRDRPRRHPAAPAPGGDRRRPASTPASGCRRVKPVEARAHGRRTPGRLAARHGDRGALRRPARADPRGLPALAGIDVSVRSAHVSTLGPQAVDVFYVQEASAGALSEERAASAAHAVRQALVDTFAPPEA